MSNDSTPTHNAHLLFDRILPAVTKTLPAKNEKTRAGSKRGAGMNRDTFEDGLLYVLIHNLNGFKHT